MKCMQFIHIGEMCDQIIITYQNAEDTTDTYIFIYIFVCMCVFVWTNVSPRHVYICRFVDFMIELLRALRVIAATATMDQI